MTRRRVAAVALTTLALTATLSACSDEDTPTASGTGATTPAPNSPGSGTGGEGTSSGDGSQSTASVPNATIDPDRVSPENLPTIPPEPKDVAGALADVKYDECSTEVGDQTVKGKVTNSTDKATDYVVVVSWINDTHDVMGRGVTMLRDVPKGKPVDFTVEAEVAKPATQCVVSAYRGTYPGGSNATSTASTSTASATG